MIKPNPIEETIVKKFPRPIWHKILKCVREYELIQEGDKIAVYISGDKYSMLMAQCLQRLQRYSKFPFEVQCILVKSEPNHQKNLENAELLGIPFQVSEAEDFPAFCEAVRKMGCSKIAVGNHFEEIIETIFMGMLYDSQIEATLPKTHIENFEGMQIIRPLYLVKESDINAWKDYNHLEFVECAEDSENSRHQEVKALLQQLRKVNPAVDTNIFRSIQNVNLKTIISYHLGDEYHHFLDDFDEGITNHGTKSGEGRKETSC